MVLDIEHFTWRKGTKILTAERSDFVFIELGRTLTIQGRTKILIFEHIYTDRDADEDVVYWEYRNKASGFSVKIWND